MKKKVKSAIDFIKDEFWNIDGNSFLIGYETGVIFLGTVIIATLKITTWVCKRKK